jgi:hypothetical protein
LTRVGWRELSELEVDHDQAAKPTMEEQEVDSVPRVTDSQSALAADECEIAAESIKNDSR